jgi:hypothetical protein
MRVGRTPVDEAKKKSRRLTLDDLRGAGKVKVRYKRANLTVDQLVSVYGTQVEAALVEQREGRGSAEQVAWAFLKEQVIRQTSSFDWADAELEVLLPRVAAVVTEPKFKARTPEDLVPELEVLEREERERWKEISAQMRKQIPTISKSVLKGFAGLDKLPVISEDMRRQITASSQITDAIGRTHMKAIQAAQPSINAFQGVRLDWEQINKTVMAQAKLTDFGIDPSAYASLVDGTAELAKNILDQQKIAITLNWDQLVEQITEAAREAEADDLVEVVEATSTEVSKEVSEVDVNVLVGYLTELSEKVKKSMKDHPFAWTILATVIARVIIYSVEYTLAVKFGITSNGPIQDR